jgi:hypothetical protein
MSDWEAENWTLRTEEGRALLAAVADVRAPGPSDLTRWRKSAPSECVAAAVRLVEARRRGRAKFFRADEMWFDAKGLEQATPETVARYKARRFEGKVADLCCGIGGDTLALAEHCSVLAVDANAGMCRRTAWNATVHEVVNRVLTIQSTAERFSVPGDMLVHIDPDRRAGTRSRARSVSDYAPGLEVLQSLLATTRGGAIKLGPASDYESHFGSLDVELELISLDGECKEATVWFGSLAGCRRRATVLPGGASWTDREGVSISAAAVVPLSGWVYDPDPALVRSGLLDGFALAHGLGRCAAGVDFLTGIAFVSSPFLSAFEVEEVVPLDIKILKRLAAERDFGSLEIKVKGLNHRPEELRRQLRLRGSKTGTLLLIGGFGPARAIVARRVPRQ